MNVSITKTLRIGSKSYSENRTLTAKASIDREVSLAAAKAGVTASGAGTSTGSLTMGSGHGITTAAKIAVFWAGGHRRNVTVGTVSGTTVPISGGSGDNLPVNGTAITAMVEEVVEVRFDGDDLVMLCASSVAPFVVWLSGDDDTEDFAITAPYTGQAYEWDSASGVTNPVAADVVTKARVAHGDSTGTRTVSIGVAIN